MRPTSEQIELVRWWGGWIDGITNNNGCRLRRFRSLFGVVKRRLINRHFTDHTAMKPETDFVDAVGFKPERVLPNSPSVEPIQSEIDRGHLCRPVINILTGEIPMWLELCHHQQHAS